MLLIVPFPDMVKLIISEAAVALCREEPDNESSIEVNSKMTINPMNEERYFVFLLIYLHVLCRCLKGIKGVFPNRGTF
jgi:hypothetical protein